jgi:hypothetical protein
MTKIYNTNANAVHYYVTDVSTCQLFKVKKSKAIPVTGRGGL